MIVKATDAYKRRNLKDAELNRIPKEGEKFEVTKERFEVLSGKNPYHEVFVEEVIEVAKKEETVETAVKKTTKKTK